MERRRKGGGQGLNHRLEMAVKERIDTNMACSIKGKGIAIISDNGVSADSAGVIEDLSSPGITKVSVDEILPFKSLREKERKDMEALGFEFAGRMVMGQQPLVSPLVVESLSAVERPNGEVGGWRQPRWNGGGKGDGRSLNHRREMAVREGIDTNMACSIKGEGIAVMSNNGVSADSMGVIEDLSSLGITKVFIDETLPFKSLRENERKDMEALGSEFAGRMVMG
ncbi:hypothetical protein LWI28_011262 [Acer negundo]|uniref:Uncharacterized protein n=1 Tax=Acer negundo TaxID=4023 RepID=A0AAD5ILB6_ACENE|nr:hypothetical protein LWI28_011262 [Acer negundo]